MSSKRKDYQDTYYSPPEKKARVEQKEEKEEKDAKVLRFFPLHLANTLPPDTKLSLRDGRQIETHKHTLVIHSSIFEDLPWSPEIPMTNYSPKAVIHMIHYITPDAVDIADEDVVSNADLEDTVKLAIAYKINGLAASAGYSFEMEVLNYTSKDNDYISEKKTFPTPENAAIARRLLVLGEQANKKTLVEHIRKYFKEVHRVAMAHEFLEDKSHPLVLRMDLHKVFCRDWKEKVTKFLAKLGIPNSYDNPDKMLKQSDLDLVVDDLGTLREVLDFYDGDYEASVAIHRARRMVYKMTKKGEKDVPGEEEDEE